MWGEESGRVSGEESGRVSGEESGRRVGGAVVRVGVVG